MIIEIDQSGKVENTHQDTIIAFSNNSVGTIVMRAKEKREVQKVFRKIGKPRMFVYRVFAILIFILIKNHLKNSYQIVIDEEYSGQENLIKSFLVREIKKIQPGFIASNIVFKRIGRKSRAHYFAYGVATGKKLADRSVSSKEVLKFLVN